MFQTFAVLSSPETGRERVARLRATFAALGIDAVLVPRADAYQGEYVPASEARLAWISGFTGSAGAALITGKQAFIFVDGRYTAQVRLQTDMDLYEPRDLIEEPPAAWIRANAFAGMRIGFDPWLHTIAEVERLEAAAGAAGAQLVPLDTNPIDPIWEDRPPEPREPVAVQPETRAGRAASDKIAMLREKIVEAGAAAFVMTDPSSIAWTFNIRGADVAHTPHPLARAIFFANDRPRLFIHREKLGDEAYAWLAAHCDLAEPKGFEAELVRLGEKSAPVLLDRALTPKRIETLVAGGNAERVRHGADPARLPRAIKNARELAGAAEAHRIDGAAMVTFLAWLDEQEPGSIDEISATKALEKARRATGEKHQSPLKDISFETIAGSGPNGAIVHYRVNENTNRQLQAGELFLVDSGGQYVAGTTDITRTVAIGGPSADMRRFFTLVLKGMIAISTARFPKGTRGQDLDPLARIALWKAGADYRHGTGHGVGAYLSVHEGPQNLSRRGTHVLEPGMILSNEPGYYRDGAFGIRIENLIVVHEERSIAGGDLAMMGFDTLTLCPIDRRLIDGGLLLQEELDWLNAYHARVRDELLPLLEERATRRWLEEATAPISR